VLRIFLRKTLMRLHLSQNRFRALLALFLFLAASMLLAQQAPNTQSSGAASSSSNQDSQSVAPPAAQSISKPGLPDSPSAVQPQQEQAPSQNSQQPTGTAAAQKGKISGYAVSEPAGVAIAPAKQHRTRSILIKMGFIAGAGIALGTVAALSAASPSKPPGAQ
jgi:cytoskeletal protein RodZ